jgi:hypothetical protein
MICQEILYRPNTRGGELAVSLQDGFEIAVFVGWAGCILSLISVVRHSSSEFNSIGRSRSRWFWINILGVVPYLGVLTALSYFFSVIVNFPEKPKTASRPRPRSSSQHQQPPGQSTRGYQAPTSWPKPLCTGCGGSGRMTCHCGGSGKAVINNEVVPDFACGGSGKVRCGVCGGSGKQGG